MAQVAGRVGSGLRSSYAGIQVTVFGARGRMGRFVAHDLGRVVDRNSIAVLRDEFLAAARILQDNGNPLLKLLQPYNGKGNK